MGAPKGNCNACGPHKMKSKFGRTGSKAWEKRVNAHARANPIIGQKGLPGYRRGKYSYRKYL